MASQKFRLAIIQLAVGAVKADNLSRAAGLVAKAAKNGAQIVTLPECCNSPYGNEFFPQYAESIPGQSTEVFSQCAKENNIFLVAGSIPERQNGKLYNTCTVYNPQGSLIATFRKLHLFDIDIPGKITFQESKTLTAGNSTVTFETPFCKIGLGICYDIRFAELAQLYAKQGCKLLLYPGAFNMITGPVHWQLLARARALDNQLYVASVAPARDETANYVAWSHSLVAGPWGDVITEAKHEETILYADIDLDRLEEIRNQIPIGKQRRDDMYI